MGFKLNINRLGQEINVQQKSAFVQVKSVLDFDIFCEISQQREIDQFPLACLAGKSVQTVNMKLFLEIESLVLKTRFANDHKPIEIFSQVQKGSRCILHSRNLEQQGIQMLTDYQNEALCI